MKTNNKNKKVKLYSLSAVLSVLLCGFFIQGCSNENIVSLQEQRDIPDKNSLELEEFIIAGLDYQHALNVFSDEVKKNDFSKIEPFKNSEGEMSVYIPTSICIEEKKAIMEEKKAALLEKYPQFLSFLMITRKFIYSNV
jgi:hypothetical protein